MDQLDLFWSMPAYRRSIAVSNQSKGTFVRYAVSQDQQAPGAPMKVSPSSVPALLFHSDTRENVCCSKSGSRLSSGTEILLLLAGVKPNSDAMRIMISACLFAIEMYGECIG